MSSSCSAVFLFSLHIEYSWYIDTEDTGHIDTEDTGYIDTEDTGYIDTQKPEILTSKHTVISVCKHNSERADRRRLLINPFFILNIQLAGF